jgi:hypothetical protein
MHAGECFRRMAFDNHDYAAGTEEYAVLGSGRRFQDFCGPAWFSGSHAPAWESISVLGSATVCIPTQKRGNE